MTQLDDLHDDPRRVVLLTMREATAILERLSTVMTVEECQAVTDMGRAYRVLSNQVAWLKGHDVSGHRLVPKPLPHLPRTVTDVARSWTRNGGAA